MALTEIGNSILANIYIYAAVLKTASPGNMP